MWVEGRRGVCVFVESRSVCRWVKGRKSVSLLVKDRRSVHLYVDRGQK